MLYRLFRTDRLDLFNKTTCGLVMLYVIYTGLEVNAGSLAELCSLSIVCF